MADLKDKTILVTGCGHGIGNELCKHLSKLGVKVIAVSKSLEALKALQTEFPKIDIIQVDLKNWNETKKSLASVPPLDGLVNNAGVAVIKPFTELTEEDFDCTFNVNIKAIFCVTQAVAEKLKYGSSIVNVSSLASSRAFAGHAAYGASKAAVDSLTKALALEFGPRKIRVNSVNPTVILTKMGIENWSDPRKSGPLINHIPLTRLGEVSDAIDSIVYLLGSQSSFVNGHHLLLEGGYSVS
ncbi:L-xylulose reductase [Eupeodes corollae]|uniref:L-xylulose reductase n=1 Tax=Eupeodes corollae TaxID=290404 RepID=UPI00248FABBB|nr:L-xylulose reductase [Eupeodes corollae]